MIFTPKWPVLWVPEESAGLSHRSCVDLMREFFVFDPLQDNEWADRYGIEYVDLNTLLEMSHIISLHVPLLPNTYHLVNEDAFSRMKSERSSLIQVAGKVIHTKALIEALKSGHIGGVALDTYEEEEEFFLKIFQTKSYWMMSCLVCSHSPTSSSQRTKAISPMRLYVPLPIQP